MVNSETISKAISFEGIGLHSGLKSKITILPGIEDQGIVFKRIDLQKKNFIKSSFKNVSASRLCTTLENEYGSKVSTVEHLLAALYIAEIDNAVIEIDNEEIPIMDGSAKIFLNVLEKTEDKIQEIEQKIKDLKLMKKSLLNLASCCIDRNQDLSDCPILDCFMESENK